MPTATSNRTSRSLVYGLNLLKLFTAERISKRLGWEEEDE